MSCVVDRNLLNAVSSAIIKKNIREVCKMQKKYGIVRCSNPQSPQVRSEIEQVCAVLSAKGAEPVLGKYFYIDEDAYTSGWVRAEELMKLYCDPEITDIFDISGGDMGNDVLDFLDYETIAASNATFWGYSDLTTVINAIYTKTGKSSHLFQIRNLVRDTSGTRLRDFESWRDSGDDSLFHFDYKFLRGQSVEGIVLGGNIRCLLKLAGTEYFPDLEGKILFLEALNGEHPQMAAQFGQLRQLGIFKKVKAVVLGTFAKMEETGAVPTVEQIALQYIPGNIPILKTRQVGHAKTSKAVIIGGFYTFNR